ncbi:hypothetical protein BC2230_10453 [Burkholderia cepacia]
MRRAGMCFICSRFTCARRGTRCARWRSLRRHALPRRHDDATVTHQDFPADAPRDAPAVGLFAHLLHVPLMACALGTRHRHRPFGRIATPGNG